MFSSQKIGQTHGQTDRGNMTPGLIRAYVCAYVRMYGHMDGHVTTKFSGLHANISKVWCSSCARLWRTWDLSYHVGNSACACFTDRFKGIDNSLYIHTYISSIMLSLGRNKNYWLSSNLCYLIKLLKYEQ